MKQEVFEAITALRNAAFLSGLDGVNYRMEYGETDTGYYEQVKVQDIIDRGVERITAVYISDLEDIKAEIDGCIPWNTEEKAMKAAVLAVIDKHISGMEAR